jgi:hypothetical protein
MKWFVALMSIAFGCFCAVQIFGAFCLLIGIIIGVGEFLIPLAMFLTVVYITAIAFKVFFIDK